MAELLLHADAQIECSHGAQARFASTEPRVRLGSRAAVTIDDQARVTGCPFHVVIVVVPKPQPCTTITWGTAATRVRAGGRPVLLVTSQSLCYSAEQIPQGAAAISAVQQRVRGV